MTDWLRHKEPFFRHRKHLTRLRHQIYRHHRPRGRRKLRQARHRRQVHLRHLPQTVRRHRRVFLHLRRRRHRRQYPSGLQGQFIHLLSITWRRRKVSSFSRKYATVGPAHSPNENSLLSLLYCHDSPGQFCLQCPSTPGPPPFTYPLKHSHDNLQFYMCMTPSY